MVTTRARLLPAMATTLCLLAALTACDKAASPDPAPSPTGSSGETSPSAGSSTGTAVEPATGQLIDLEVLSYHLPEDLTWRLGTRDGSVASAFDDDVFLWQVTVNETQLAAGSPETIDEAADIAAIGTTDTFETPLVRGDNRVVDGVEGYTAEAVQPDPESPELVLVWGTAYHRKYVSITFQAPAEDPRSRTRFEALLASVAWK